MVADKPYGEFHDFYSVSMKYFGYTLIFLQNTGDCYQTAEKAVTSSLP
jgi:hypothetical protein